MEGFGGLRLGVSGEKAALDHLHQPRINGVEPAQKLVQRKPLFDFRLNRNLPAVGRLETSAPLLAPPPSRIVDDHLPHGASRDREEVVAILPAAHRLIHELQIRLVDEPTRFERLRRPPAAELSPRDAPQLRVDERHELVEGAGSAFAMCCQDGGNALREWTRSPFR